MATVMQKNTLGKTDLQVTEIAFGGASVGNLYRAIDNAQAEAAIQAAWQAGIRYFDTAPQYGHGLSEHRLGHVLREYPREEFVLSTKVGEVFSPASGKANPDEEWFVNPLPFESTQDYSYDAVMRGVEHSLHRLGLNQVDILHIHDLDHICLGEDFERHFQTAMTSGYKALNELREQGVVKALSLGVKEWQVCERALEYGDFDCFMLQGNYTLLEQPAKAFLDRCVERQLSVIQAGPFSSGVLVKGPVEDATHHHTPAEQHVIDQVKKIQGICADFTVPMPAVAMHFTLSHPAIAAVAIGLRSPEQVAMNMAWYQTAIPEGVWEALRAEGIIDAH